MQPQREQELGLLLLQHTMVSTSRRSGSGVVLLLVVMINAFMSSARPISYRRLIELQEDDQGIGIGTRTPAAASAVVAEAPAASGFPTATSLRRRMLIAPFSDRITDDMLAALEVATDAPSRQMALFAILDAISGGRTRPSAERAQAYIDLAQAKAPLASVVCEIGLGAGYSMASWIAAADDMQTVEAYAVNHPSDMDARNAATFFAALLPGRFHFYVGTSSAILPYVVSDINVGSRARCDMFFIDGYIHGDTPAVDLRNAARMSAPGAMVVSNNCPCAANLVLPSSCVNVCDAFSKAMTALADIETGRVSVTESTLTASHTIALPNEHGMSVARVPFTTPQ